MPTRNISLTREQDEYIAAAVAAGEYQNASEAVRDALRALQQRKREDELKLATLRAQLKAGIRELDAGEFAVVEVSDIEKYLSRLTPRRGRSRRRTR